MEPRAVGARGKYFLLAICANFLDYSLHHSGRTPHDK
jgi:hypothetical protein